MVFDQILHKPWLREAQQSCASRKHGCCLFFFLKKKKEEAQQSCAELYKKWSKTTFYIKHACCLFFFKKKKKRPRFTVYERSLTKFCIKHVFFFIVKEPTKELRLEDLGLLRDQVLNLFLVYCLLFN